MQVLLQPEECIRVKPMYSNLTITVDYTNGSSVEIKVQMGEDTLRPPLYKGRVRVD